MTEATLLNIVLMLAETPGMIAPAATATKPAIRAYSIRSCPRLSAHNFAKVKIARILFIVIPPLKSLAEAPSNPVSAYSVQSLGSTSNRVDRVLRLTICLSTNLWKGRRIW